MPVLKALALVALAMPLASASQTPARNYYQQVHQVMCDRSRGTAVRISEDTYLSVHHVSVNKGCRINGEMIRVVEESPELDFSILHTSRTGRGMKISCEGIRPGSWVFAVGYANGWPIQRMTMHLATPHKSNSGFVVLLGHDTVIPGMSGGPVLNAKGEIVGMVNAYNRVFGMSFSRDLKDTSVCQ